MNSDTYNIPKEAFSYICRTCLLFTDDDDIFSITNFSWESIILKDILLAYTGIEMEENYLPGSMCKTCIKKLFEVDRFIQKCRSSNDLLKNMFLKEHSKELNSLKENESFTETSNIELCFIEDDVDSDHFKEALLNVKEYHKNGKPEGTSMNWHYYDSKEENTVDIPSEMDISNQKLLNTVHVLKSELKTIDKEYISSQKEKLGLSYIGPSLVKAKGPPYTCVTCEASFDKYDEWKTHRLETKHHCALKYKCTYCPKVSFRSTSMAEHIRSHTGEKPNKCPTCNKAFNGKSDLRRHQLSVHAEVKPYKCKFCDKSFGQKQYLVGHERKHTGEVVVCPICGKGYHSYHSLYNHERIHKGVSMRKYSSRVMSQDESSHICQICNKTFSSVYTLNTHMLLHGPKDFNCEKCGKTYATKQKLKQHIEYAHEEPKFPCTLCSKVYKQKYDLKTHMNYHTGEKMYRCDICGKTFAYRGSLQDHRRIHTGDTRYQCKVCLKICLNKRFLQVHMRTHTGEKPYSCDYCGRRFACRSNMSEHVKIHRGEKNHSCEICGKSFLNSRTLKKHTAVHLKN